MSTLRSLCVGNCAIFHDPCTIHEQAIALCTKYAKVFQNTGYEGNYATFLRPGNNCLLLTRRSPWLDTKEICGISHHKNKTEIWCSFVRAKACRLLEVEETVEACRFAKPYPSTFFAFCWQVQFSLLLFASWICTKQWNVFHCLELCMEAEPGGGGSLARLLMQVHCNSSLLQKPSFSFFKSLLWPTKHKDGQSSLPWNWSCLSTQVQYKFYIGEIPMTWISEFISQQKDASPTRQLFKRNTEMINIVFREKWSFKKTPLRVRQRSGAVSFLSISKSSPKSFFPPPLLLCWLKATAVWVYCCATKRQLFIKTKFCLLPTSKNLTVNILLIFCSTLSLGLDV